MSSKVQLFTLLPDNAVASNYDCTQKIFEPDNVEPKQSYVTISVEKESNFDSVIL